MWKIMAADDEAYIREALQKLIDWEKMDCRLLSVSSNGRELLDNMEDEHPDIVITDIQMPEVDGLEICKYIYDYCPEIKVIILSAHSDFEYAKKAIKYNVSDYVLKISIIEELPEAVEKVIMQFEKNREEIKKKDMDEPSNLYTQIVQYIEERYMNKITLDEIADELHVNRSYVSRLYKNKSGINLFDAILEKRIEVAKEYLRATEMRTYEISAAVGIEDAGYFSKMFKKKTGISPKDYRRNETI